MSVYRHANRLSAGNCNPNLLQLTNAIGVCFISQMIREQNPRMQSLPDQRAASRKISFCTTCKNRLWQLSHTMPGNLGAIAADGCSEIVLVNYNSEDGLHEWICQFRPAIEAGKLRYVHERSDPGFHLSKAKNLAHFAATGDFVVNLDADNFIGDTIARYRRFWEDNPDTVIQGFCGVH